MVDVLPEEAFHEQESRQLRALLITHVDYTRYNS